MDYPGTELLMTLIFLRAPGQPATKQPDCTVGISCFSLYKANISWKYADVNVYGQRFNFGHLTTTPNSSFSNVW